MSIQSLEQDSVSEVASLLIPLHEKQLILPNVTVAEIIPYRTPTAVSDNNNWLLGQLEWRNVHIPVLSYELLSGVSAPSLEGARLAVINGTGSNTNLPFYGILIQGIPKLTHVQENDIVSVDAMNFGPYDQMAVSVSGEQAMIPNLEQIENELLRFIG